MSISFGQVIREKRLVKGYTMRKFAKMVDLSSAFISQMERDKISFPSEKKIINIAKLLDLDSDHLLLLARKIPKDIESLLIKRPVLFAFLKRASQKSDAELDAWIAEEKLKDKESIK